MSTRIRFVEVGRDRKTWEAAYPLTAPLAEIVTDTDWWPRQLARALRSDPEWALDKDGRSVLIFAGWCQVGHAVVVEDGRGENAVGQQPGRAAQ